MNSVLIYFPPLFFLLMGLTALTNPVNVTKYFGLTGLNEDMRSEVRVVSGGFGVAICIILLAATRIDAIREFFGYGCRCLYWDGVGSVMERPVGPYPYVFLGVEIVLAEFCCQLVMVRCEHHIDRSVLYAVKWDSVVYL